jgi:hypothetical protein
VQAIVSKPLVAAVAALLMSLAGWPGSHPASPRAGPAAMYNLKGAPRASFTWSPEKPKVGQTALFASTSTATTSPIRSYAWDFSGNDSFGPFEPGGPTVRTSFSTPADHVVRLRVTAADGQSDIAVETVHMSPPRRGVLTPFPVIRIVGTLVRRGVRIRLLTVRAPAGARITATCSSHRICHVRTAKAVARRRRPVRFHTFERLIPAGARIQVRVTKPGSIGAYTSFLVRHHRLPVRRDSCLNRAGVRPIPCPS